MREQNVPAWLVVKVILVIVAVVAAIAFLYLTRQIVGILLISAFFAIAMAPAVNWLDQHRLPRAGAILLVYVALAGAIVGVGLLLVPPVVNGVDRLSQDLPGYVTDLRNNETFRKYDNKYEITPKLREQAANLPDRLGSAAGSLATVTVNVFTKLIQLVTILVITFFLLIDGQRILEFFYRHVDPANELRAREIAAGISKGVSGYVLGNLLISVMAGTFTYVVLSILDVPFAVPLAVLFAFLDLIPLVGATLGGAAIAIVTAFVDFPTALIVWGIAFIIYQQIENNVMQPAIYGRTVELHPISVLIAVLIGGSLLGILGALLAIPAAATVQILIKAWWAARRERLTPAVGESPA